MAIGTTIKTIQDIMRKDAGGDGDAQRISQLVWMIFLKIFDDRVESELAWRVPIQDIRENGYNLDIKNPHTVDVTHRDFGEMLGDYRSLEGDVADTREQLRQVLMATLEN
jgi:type I restriction-modification system DNA methylase subunit